MRQQRNKNTFVAALSAGVASAALLIAAPASAGGIGVSVGGHSVVSGAAWREL